jgi:transglycosylase-like protein with SLT domain
MAVDATGLQATGSAGSGVTGAIYKAANRTGVSFQYMLATAQVESRLNPNAAARTSSARGLYQFIDQTWLATMKSAGDSLGYGRYADAITRLPSGNYVVNDPALRDDIMKLRNDPAANAAMAGAFTLQNAERLQDKLGRPATDGELYIAHFLGAGGAGRLISQAEQSPNAIAADAFPGAARANRSIFYDKQGSARTVAQVYDQLVGRYDTARVQSINTLNTMMADHAGVPSTVAPPTVAPAAKVAPVTRTPIENLPVVPDAPAIGTVAQADAPMRTASAAEPMFHSMFRPEDRAGGVSQLVRDLWTTRPQVAAALTGMAVAPASGSDGSAGTGLDLFKDQSRFVQGLYDRRT